MIIQVTFGTLCRDFIDQFKPLVIDFLKREYPDMHPLDAFEYEILNHKGQIKWRQRVRNDHAYGDEIIDFASIYPLFTNETSFLDSYNVDNHEVLSRYLNALYVRNLNAHMNHIEKYEVEDAIDDVYFLADCFNLDLDQDQSYQNDIVSANSHKNEYYCKDDNDLKCKFNRNDYKEILILTSLFLEDFRIIIRSFYESRGQDFDSVIEGYLLSKNYYEDVMYADAAECIDYSFVRSFINHHTDELVRLYGWKIPSDADYILYEIKNSLTVNRNLVQHQTDGNVEAVKAHIKDLYDLFDLDYEKLMHRTNAFRNFSYYPRRRHFPRP